MASFFYTLLLVAQHHFDNSALHHTTRWKSNSSTWFLVFAKPFLQGIHISEKTHEALNLFYGLHSVLPDYSFWTRDERKVQPKRAELGTVEPRQKSDMAATKTFYQQHILLEVLAIFLSVWLHVWCNTQVSTHSWLMPKAAAMPASSQWSHWPYQPEPWIAAEMGFCFPVDRRWCTRSYIWVVSSLNL